MRIVAATLLMLALGLAGSVVAAEWPPTDEDLVFLFQDGYEEAFALDEELAEPLMNFAFKREGEARLTSAGFIKLDFGRVTAPNQGKVLHAAFAEGAGFGLELRLKARACSGRILALGEAVSLRQEGTRLMVAVKVGTERVHLETQLDPEKDHHLLVGRNGDRLTLYHNGEPVADRPCKGNYDSWTIGAFTLGDGDLKRAGWCGEVAHVAWYTGMFDAARAKAHFEASDELFFLSKKPERLKLEGKVVGMSKIASPEEVAPYSESLAVFEYEVVKLLEGLTWDKKIRATRWVVLGHQATAAANTRIGDTHVLVLEPFSANRQLAGVNRSETLLPDNKVKLYHSLEVMR